MLITLVSEIQFFSEQMDVIMVIMFMTLPSSLYILTFYDYTFNVIIP